MAGVCMLARGGAASAGRLAGPQLGTQASASSLGGCSGLQRRHARPAPSSDPLLQLACTLGRSSRPTRGLVTAMAGTGKFFVGGNWKCNGTRESISKLVDDLNSATIESDVDVVVSPPSVYLDRVQTSISKRMEVAAQNCWIGKGGAFTGEVSAEMLVDLDIPWVILGHSERRHILKETNEFVGKKQAYALDRGLKVISCVGELLEERESGHTFDVVFGQLKATADAISSWDNVVVAYEPVWAIGTGQVASPQQAQEVHAAIRNWLKENVSAEAASKTRIIYGGSVNGANCASLAKEEDIDGFLVGGASLKGPEFAAIVNSVTFKKVAV